jgi:hypothetical protein
VLEDWVRERGETQKKRMRRNCLPNYWGGTLIPIGKFVEPWVVIVDPPHVNNLNY